MRKRFIWLLGIIALTLFSFFGCNETKEEESFQLQLSQDSITITENFDFELKTNYSGKSEVLWSSKDEEIASVSNGTVKGVEAGTTVVYATVEEQTVSCEVTVEAFDFSSLRVAFNDISRELYVGDGVTLDCSLYYGNERIEGVAFSFSVLNGDACTLSNNVATAQKIGATNICASSSYMGYDVYGAITLTVKSDAAIRIENKNVSLFPLAEYKGESYTNTVQVVGTVKEKGVSVENATIEWSVEDERICTVNDRGSVQALKVGRTVLTASYGEGDNRVTDSIYVDVSPVCLSFNQTIRLDKSKAFAFESGALLNDENVQIASVYLRDENNSYDVSFAANALDVSQVPLNGATKIVFDTGNILFDFNAYVWTKVIETNEELALLYAATTGHYLLNADLDLTDYEGNLSEGATFTGVFDGNGKTISGLSVKRNGLFYRLGNGACIRNLALSEATIDKSVSQIGCLANSVETKANVEISDLSAEIMIFGKGCGGLFGNSKPLSQIKGTGVKLFTYSTNEGNGALLAAGEGSVAFENSTIYSSLPACGDSISEGNSNKDAINEGVTITRPTLYDSANNQRLNAYGAGEKTFAFSSVSNIEKGAVYANAKKVLQTNSVALSFDDYKYINSPGVEALFQAQDGTISYFIIGVYAELHINQSNVNDLKLIEKGKIVLDEDISIGQWSSSKYKTVGGESTLVESHSFNGEFDGQGHVINGLHLTEAGSGLFYYLQGTVKNVAVKNVTLPNGNNGTFGYMQGEGDLTFENVYVQVSSYRFDGFQGALIERNGSKDAKTIVKNCYVEMPSAPKMEGRYAGFVSGYKNSNYQIENSVFVGGSKTVAASDTINEASEAYEYFEGADSLRTAVKENNFALPTEEITSWFDEFNNIVVVEINQSNFTRLKELNGNETVYLTSDIDMSSAPNWISKVSFTGVLDGRGHTISNLDVGGTTESNDGNETGLFKSLSGATIKNVAFVNARVGYYGQKSSVIAFEITSGVASTIENVFISVEFGYEAYAGAISNYPQNASLLALQLNNCVIEVKGVSERHPDRQGFVSGWRMTWTKLTNCYFISDSCSSLYGSNTACSGTLDDSSTYTTYGTASEKTARQNFLAAKAAGSVSGLSAQMETYITNYIN